MDSLLKRTFTKRKLCSEKWNEPHAKQHLQKAHETREKDIQFYIDNDIELPYLPRKKFFKKVKILYRHHFCQ